MTNNNQQSNQSLDNLPEVLEVSEVRDILRISRASAYKLMKQNSIQSFKIGSQIRVLKSSLIAYMLKQ